MQQDYNRKLAPRRSVFFNIVEANKFRKMKGIDMPPIRTGKRECLRCEKSFISEDLKNQKMCNYCRGNV
jgi:late competence protein required for DNA uptake (superfamily II DNA/RNA helicase)